MLLHLLSRYKNMKNSMQIEYINKYTFKAEILLCCLNISLKNAYFCYKTNFKYAIFKICFHANMLLSRYKNMTNSIKTEYIKKYAFKAEILKICC